jgi:hypothetical protein
MTDDDRKPGAAADLIEDLLAEDEKDAADRLGAGFGAAYLRTRGPHDMAPGGDAPLRVTVGPQ